MTTLATSIKSVLHRSTLMTNKTLVGRRWMSKVARWDECYYDKQEVVESFRNELVHIIQEEDKEYEKHEESYWIPDPRTGIYYPKGHEWVMKDIPDGAASFTYNYWFRNCDIHGV